MRSHELARVLLAEPDAEVAVSAMGHVYRSLYHRGAHGPLQIGTMEGDSSGPDRYIVIGHMLSKENCHPERVDGIRTIENQGEQLGPWQRSPGLEHIGECIKEAYAAAFGGKA